MLSRAIAKVDRQFDGGIFGCQQFWMPAVGVYLAAPSVGGASLYAFAKLDRSDLTPTRSPLINQLKLDRRNSEQRDHGRLGRALLHSVIMRGPGDAPDKSAGKNRNSIVRIEVGAAVNPPRSGEYEREAIGGVGMRSAHVARVPLHPSRQDKARACPNHHKASPSRRCAVESRLSSRST
jgi:hypothetical protein